MFLFYASALSEHSVHFVTAGTAHTNLTKKKKKIWFIVCRWVSVSTLNIKDCTHADMKTILLDGTEKPVRGVQSLTRLYWLWRKVNYGFPGIALYQHVQLVNKVGRERIQVSVLRVDEEHQGSGFDHRWCVSASKWPRLSAGVSARLSSTDRENVSGILSKGKKL